MASVSHDADDKGCSGKNFSDIKVLPVDTFPYGNHNIAAEETTQLALDAGVDAVIIGNAA